MDESAILPRVNGTSGRIYIHREVVHKSISEEALLGLDGVLG
jgi:hypothetical protein